ncbi:MAG: hypothetical protein JXA36_07045 [Coriobacteriia bacterium]|nr:hypothetical protein [Coriobacteriia bacterium]
MKQHDAEPSRGQSGINAVIALILVAVAVALMVAAFQLDSCATRAEVLDARLEAARAILDAEVGSFVSVSSAHDPTAEFSADLAAVYESVNSLKALRNRLAVIRSDVTELTMPTIVPSGRAGEMRQVLVERADALAEYNDMLLASAEFAVDRTEAFEAVANTLDTLQRLADEGVTIEQAEQLVRDVRADYDASLGRMRAGSSAAPVLYSNTQVLQRLEEISAALGEIEAAIVARDQGRIDAAFQSYVALVETDWLARLALNSDEGLQAIDRAALVADDAVETYQQAREDVDQARQLLFLGGLVTLIAALVFGVRAVLMWEAAPGR